MMADVEVMKKAKVVGMTTTGAARHQSALRTLLPRIVIVEEAAEVLEAHLLASLTIACEHLILIGDHQQLRPNPAVYELAKKYNMDVSLFERLVKNGFPYRMLNNQHRMCTDISRTLMPHFYENLQDDPSVFERVLGVTKNLMFINHSYPEISEKDIKSHSNIFEAKFCLKLARYFLQQGYKGHQVTILCTYLDQLLLLRKSVDSIVGERERINIQNVDNYQGEESDIIILSLVRSNNPEGKIGFLKIPNRVCVALSRARMGLYVVCNMDFLAKNCELWKQIKTSIINVGALQNSLTVKCQMHGKQQLISCGEDFDIKCREGGCDAPCNTRLNCGHVCPKPCHVDDMEHIKFECLKPCARTCISIYKHPCKKLCYEECGSCKVKVRKQLPCLHVKMDYCYLKPEKIKCVDKCAKFLPCGHPCDQLCGSPCTKTCNALVRRILPGCSHFGIMKCYEDPKLFQCKEKVPKLWPICNHTVDEFCYVDVKRTRCPKPCKMILPNCDHVCQGSCGECRNGRLHIRCEEKCKKILICGHECPLKCSNACSPCQKLCQTACAHSQCGKVAPLGEKLKKIRANENQKDPTSGRLCGDPCPPCVEACLNKCIHRQCAGKCSEPCTVEPCNEPCRKLLNCSIKKMVPGWVLEGKRERLVLKEKVTDPHYCIGVCGEDCLKICKKCNPEKMKEIQEILFGGEEEEGAMFMKLKDCDHIFEVKGLDKWLKSKLPETDDSTVEVVDILCPKCKTPIRKSKRYVKILNTRAADIEQIKYQIRGLTVDERKKEQILFNKEVENVISNSSKTFTDNVISGLKQGFSRDPPTLMTKSWFAMGRNMLNIVKQLLASHNRAFEHLFQTAFKVNDGSLRRSTVNQLPYLEELKQTFKITSFWDYLNDDCYDLLMKVDMNDTSETIIQQMAYEVARFSFLTEIFIYFNQLTRASNDLREEHTPIMHTILSKLFLSYEFKDDYETGMCETLWHTFKDFIAAHPAQGFGLSDKERIEIIKATNGSVTKWYKCPKGHMYGIGECGQAMVETKCPECGTVIGGQNHHLQAGNIDATTEMRQGLGALHIPDPFVVRFGPEW